VTKTWFSTVTPKTSIMSLGVTKTRINVFVTAKEVGKRLGVTKTELHVFVT